MNADIRQELDAVAAALENCEFNEAAQKCRVLLCRLEKMKATTDLINEARSRLISALMNMCGPYNRDESILRQIDIETDKLFTGFLTTRLKDRAAKTLLEKIQFLADHAEWNEALSTAHRLIELFGRSSKKQVQEHVNDAYIFLLQKSDQSELENLCVSYGKFLETYYNFEESIEIVGEIDDALDGNSNTASIDIINRYLYARADEISLDQEAYLRSKLASNYLYVGMNKETIEACTWIFMNKNDDDNILDHLLWCGEAYMNMGKNIVASMYFREVQRSLSADPSDDRSKKANSFLNEII